MVALARSATEILDSLFNHAVREKLLTSATFRRGRFGILFSVLSSEIATWEQILEILRKECFLDTATTGENIEKITSPLRYRSPSKNSRSSGIFFWNVPYEQRAEDKIIPYGQIVETSETNPIQYITTETRTLYKEQDYIRIPLVSRLTGKDTYVEPETLVSLEPGINYVSVINDEESWGGADQETYEDLRTHSKSTRYALEKGTRGALELVLLECGLEKYQYNLVENIHGYGNFAIYIDTMVDEYVDYVKTVLQREKAAGIYMNCKAATQVLLDISFTIKIATPADLLPKEREMLKKDLTQAFTEFVR